MSDRPAGIWSPKVKHAQSSHLVERQEQVLDAAVQGRQQLPHALHRSCRRHVGAAALLIR